MTNSDELKAGDTIKVGDAEITVPPDAAVICDSTGEPIGVFWPDANDDTKGATSA